MAGRELASEAALAAYDAKSARAFGRQVSEGGQPWRTGPAGEMTVEEYDLESGLAFGRLTGAEAVEARARVAETERQIAVERELIESAGRVGWAVAVQARPVAERQIAEAVRSRVEIREVTGWEPKPWRAGGR